MPATERRTVHIDGDCALCNSFARFVARRDKRRLFEFIPGNATDTVRLVEGGRTYERSSAALRVMAELGFPWSWLSRAGLIVPRPLRDAVYDWIARRRRRIACRLD
jgi:predicted DCC family thiol-disulfide oxidoreductase YuxK